MPTEEKHLAILHLEGKIENYLKEEADRKKAQSEARYDIEGESLTTGHWTRSTKEYHLRNTINEFKTTDNDSTVPCFETPPKQMTKMARDYYEATQHVDVPDDDYGRMMYALVTGSSALKFEPWALCQLDAWLAGRSALKFEPYYKLGVH
jgi:hypothetical protein